AGADLALQVERQQILNQIALLAGGIAPHRIAIAAAIGYLQQFVGVDPCRAGPPQAVKIGVARDTEQPGRHRTLAAKRQQTNAGLDKGLLRQLFREIGRAAESIQVLLHWPTKALVEILEREALVEERLIGSAKHSVGRTHETLRRNISLDKDRRDDDTKVT